MNLAKLLIVLNKNYCNHRAPMQWNGSFWPKISPFFAFRQAWLIRYSRTKHAVQFYLGNRTTAHREYLMGCAVNNLLKFWVHKLSFLKRHPSIQKGKNETPHTYRGKRENSFRWVSPASLIDPLQEEEWIKLQTKYGIELTPTDLVCLVISVENLVKF
jgi:hypothetical protein